MFRKDVVKLLNEFLVPDKDEDSSDSLLHKKNFWVRLVLSGSLLKLKHRNADNFKYGTKIENICYLNNRNIFSRRDAMFLCWFKRPPGPVKR